MKINTNDHACGRCGEGVKYEYSNGRLTISGTGAMDSYRHTEEYPFADLRDKVEQVEILRGVTNTGDMTFCGYSALRRVDVAGSVDMVGYRAFSECPNLRVVRLAEGVRVLGPKAFENCPRLEYLELPESLQVVDFKCFMRSTKIKTVRYGGTEADWSRRVRIGRSATGNVGLERATRYCRAHSRRYYQMAAELSAIIKRGGDGDMHIVTPDLTVPGVKGKSGDCTLIILPDGKTMMIDAGLPACFVHIIELLDALDLRSLDFFMLSHPHSDHFGGLAKVADYLASRGGRIGEFIYSGYAHKGIETKLEAMMHAHGTHVRCNLCAGDTLNFGEVHAEIFNPIREEVAASTEHETDTEGVNDISTGMIMSFGGLRYLTSGDLYAGRERMLAAKLGDGLRANAAKTNHHGLFTSNTDEWISAISPQVLISDSDDAPWTSFAEKLAALGIEHYIVNDRGLTALTMSRDGRMSVETEH